MTFPLMPFAVSSTAPTWAVHAQSLNGNTIIPNTVEDGDVVVAWSASSGWEASMQFIVQGGRTIAGLAACYYKVLTTADRNLQMNPTWNLGSYVVFRHPNPTTPSVSLIGTETGVIGNAGTYSETEDLSAEPANTFPVLCGTWSGYAAITGLTGTIGGEDTAVTGNSIANTQPGNRYCFGMWPSAALPNASLALTVNWSGGDTFADFDFRTINLVP